MDNRYYNYDCPPLMNDGRFLSSYIRSNVFDQYVRTVNSINTSQEYKHFLQNNGDQIINNLKSHLKQNNTCKIKNNEINKINILEDKIEQLENKINNISNNTLNNNISNNNSNVNNGTVNIYINKTGTENVLELNDSEKNEIFNKELSGIVSFIKFINFNCFPNLWIQKFQINKIIYNNIDLIIYTIIKPLICRLGYIYCVKYA
jgi:hypothetical protein